MKLSSKEIIALSAVLSERLTEGLNLKELLILKLFVNQLNNDINTIYALQTLQNNAKTQK